jgi:N-acetylglucosamine kinase-like BadF-type ATPase
VNAFLGVDGGGSKTDFLLIDESGRVLAERREGSAYYLETGADALEHMLGSGIHATLAQASVSPADVAYAVFGLPAYGEDSARLSRLDRIAASILPVERYRCVNDMVCGWAGALAGCDGISIVAGTGSIAYGEFQGRSARAGGWGEQFSDEGSAYWVVREALNLFSRMSDGRAARAPLYDLIREHFQLRGDLDVCAAVYGPRAAGAGDGAAYGIFETAARELAAIVHAVRDALAVPQRTLLPVSYSGGMFQLDNLLMPMLRAALETGGRQYEFAKPRLSPSAGAALYAAKLAARPLTPEALTELARTHEAFAEGSP